jgi:hypothetical protein
MRPHPAPHSTMGDLVRAMVKVNRLDSTHVRTVLAHSTDGRGVFDRLLGDAVVAGLVGVGIDQTDTVEAFSCNLLGTSFHGLTFSMRTHPDDAFSLTEVLRPLPPGTAGDAVDEAAETLRPASFARFDAPRRPRSVFDGTTNEEFLIELPALDPTRQRRGDRVSFRECAIAVAGLANELDRPLSFVHAPVSAPTPHAIPRSITGPCLRVGVAFPRFEDRLRLRFGIELVGICCREGYGLWQRGAVAGMAEHDYWQRIVRLPSARSRARSDRQPPPSYRAGNTRAGGRPLAVTCVGTAVSGSSSAILQVLEEADAPLGGLAATTLDDMAIIHLTTRTPLDRDALAQIEPDLRADLALGAALGLDDPPTSDRLEHFRILATQRDEVVPNPTLAAIWLAWGTPATSVALRLTVRTLRDALDAIAGRYRGGVEDVDESHLNIEYLVGREVSDDWIRGRMKVAIDLHALGRLHHGPGEAVSPASLGQFCSDVERQWRSLLTNALGTANIDLEVVWRESWIGRWASMHVDPRDPRDGR